MKRGIKQNDFSDNVKKAEDKKHLWWIELSTCKKRVKVKANKHQKIFCQFLWTMYAWLLFQKLLLCRWEFSVHKILKAIWRFIKNCIGNFTKWNMWLCGWYRQFFASELGRYRTIASVIPHVIFVKFPVIFDEYLKIFWFS